MSNIIPPSDAPLKRCSTCPEGQQWHPATTVYFHVRNAAPDGVVSRCKNCIREYGKRYRKENAAEIAGKKKQYAKDHQGHIRDYGKQYRSDHKDTLSDAKKQYAQTHKHRIQVYKRRYYLDHKDAVLERSIRYHKSHRTERLIKLRRYYQEHKAAHAVWRRGYAQTHRHAFGEYNKKYYHSQRGKLVSRAQNHRRRARKKATPGTLTATQIQAKLKAQRYRCYYAACGHAKFEKRNGEYIFHVEHTIPVSRTEASPRHDLNYVVLACPACNLSKGAKLPHEWPEGGRLL